MFVNSVMERKGAFFLWLKCPQGGCAFLYYDHCSHTQRDTVYTESCVKKAGNGNDHINGREKGYVLDNGLQRKQDQS